MLVPGLLEEEAERGRRLAAVLAGRGEVDLAHAGDRVHVLDRDRHAVQQAQIIVTGDDHRFDAARARGLKAGLYTSPGPKTCAGYAGAWQHEAQDAARFVEWGFDFLKYDWCSYGKIARDKSLDELQKPYALMGGIRAARGRFVMAVSGGQTPWMMLRALSALDVPWGKVHIFQVDERVAPEGDVERNLTHIQAQFTNRVGIPPGQVYAMPVLEANLDEAAATWLDLYCDNVYDERRHEAIAAVRLVNKDGDVIWATTQESLGAKFRGASADVADKITRALLADIERALRAVLSTGSPLLPELSHAITPSAKAEKSRRAASPRSGLRQARTTWKPRCAN